MRLLYLDSRNERLQFSAIGALSPGCRVHPYILLPTPTSNHRSDRVRNFLSVGQVSRAALPRRKSSVGGTKRAELFNSVRHGSITESRFPCVNFVRSRGDFNISLERPSGTYNRNVIPMDISRSNVPTCMRTVHRDHLPVPVSILTHLSYRYVTFDCRAVGPKRYLTISGMSLQQRVPVPPSDFETLQAIAVYT